MTGDPARYDVPNVRGIVGWCVFVWLSSAAGVVVAGFAGNWPAVLYAVSAAVSAAGWFLAVGRWAEWRATAEAAIRELETRDGRP